MADKKDPTVEFTYDATHLPTPMHVSGGIGGATPQGEVYLSLFTERHPVPLRTTTAIVDGRLSTESKVTFAETPAPLVRDVRFACVMSPDVARSLATWLTKNADEVERLMKTGGPKS